MQELKNFIAQTDLPSLGPEVRANRLSASEIERQLEDAAESGSLSLPCVTLLRSALLLWNDYLDESHSLSQEIHNSDGSLLHGIMHRREPDYSNAKYWFHRAGTHPCYERIPRQIGSIDDPAVQSGFEEIFAGGAWDPDVFVDACQKARSGGSEDEQRRLQVLQREEMEAFLDYLNDKCGS